MGKAADWYRLDRRAEVEKSRPKVALEERKALSRLRREAKAAGAVLKNAGTGGLPSSFALGVYRKHQYTCAVHGDRGEGEYGGLVLHHRRYAKPGQRDRIEDVFVVCDKAHESIHNPEEGES